MNAMKNNKFIKLIKTLNSKKIFVIIFIFSTIFLCAKNKRESDYDIINQSAISKTAALLAAQIASNFTSAGLPLNKNNLALFPFQTASNPEKASSQNGSVTAKGIDRTFTDLLTVELNKTGEFDLIDRENIKKTMAEMALGLSGAVEGKEANDLGKIVAAHFFLNGSINESGGFYIITVNLTRVETGEIILSEKAEFIKEQMNSLAVITLLEPKSPLVAGFRSATVPGWGQFYNDSKLKGSLFLTCGVAAGGTAAALALTAKIFERQGNEQQVAYNSWGSWPEQEYEKNREKAAAHYENMKEYYDKAQMSARAVNIALASYGAIWFFSVVDGIISARYRQKRLDKARQNISTFQIPKRSAFVLAPVINKDHLGLCLRADF